MFTSVGLGLETLVQPGDLAVDRFETTSNLRDFVRRDLALPAGLETLALSLQGFETLD